METNSKIETKGKKQLKNRVSRKKKTVRKSLESIISELVKKDKYEDWVLKGSYFTYRSNKLSLPFKYKFIDMNGKVISGQMQSKEYRSDLEENIPIFGQVFKKDPNFVNQGNFRIVPISGRLTTAGLATCSGLSMTVGKRKFLTHLDATTDIQPMISTLLKLIKTEEVLPTNINIYPGNLDSNLTEQKAKDIITGIGADLDSINIHRDTCMLTDIVV
jgi:mRNA-degrading endonuclease YafQ of YafQ-DinJ toxin-antitoxin module